MMFDINQFYSTIQVFRIYNNLAKNGNVDIKRLYSSKQKLPLLIWWSLVQELGDL